MRPSIRKGAAGKKSSFFFFVTVSFSNADGSAGTTLGGSSSMELQVLADDKTFSQSETSVVANACTDTPPRTPQWDGRLAFKHPTLNSSSDCLTINIAIKPRSLTMSHSRDPAASAVTATFDTLFDVDDRTTCCSLDTTCPRRSIDEPFYLSFNQVILVDNSNADRKDRLTSRGRTVDIAIIGSAPQATNTAVVQLTNPAGGTANGAAAGGGLEDWQIAVIVIAALLVVCCLLILGVFLAKRRKIGQPKQQLHASQANLLASSEIESGNMGGGGYSSNNSVPGYPSAAESVELARDGADQQQSGYSEYDHAQLRRSGHPDARPAASEDYGSTNDVDQSKPAY
jgi:hypothetical protein